MANTNSLENFILLDFGTGITKLGLAFDQQPRLNIPTCINFPKYILQNDLKDEGPIFGEYEQDFKGTIDKKYIFADPEEKSYDNVEKFIKFIFLKTNISTIGKYLVFTQSLDWSDNFIQKLKRFFYTQFKFASIFSEISDYFALINHNLTSGTILDIGYFTSRCVSFNDHQLIRISLAKTKIGSKVVNNYLRLLFQRQFKHIYSPIFDKIIENIKCKKCWCELQLRHKLGDPQFLKEHTEQMEIPRFTVPLNIGIEKILAPEVLFNPLLIHSTDSPIQDLLIQSLKQTHSSIRQLLFSNVVICGGETCLPHFIDKLMDYYKNIPILTNAKFFIEAEPNLSIWHGMKIFIEKDMYFEHAITKEIFFQTK